MTFARSPSIRIAVVAATISVGLLGALAAPANAQTYVANCGNTHYLTLRPDHWSSGCTGGAQNVVRLKWTRYTTGTATARGTAELRDPRCLPTCYEARVYRFSARLRMSRPRRCSSGPAAGARFFSRVEVKIRYRAGTPFGPSGAPLKKSRWKTTRWPIRAYEGACDWSP
jgi:hypothetical protein